MNAGITVTVNLGSLPGFQRALVAMNSSHPPQPVVQMYNKWASLYSTFVVRRFRIQSRGGGDWAPLALSTINARKKPTETPAIRTIKRTQNRINRGDGGSLGPQYLARDTARGSINLVRVARKTSILINTGKLVDSIQVGNAANRVEIIPGGINYGFRPSIARPPDGKAKGGPMTFGRLATIHHFGTRHIPPRPILVRPDAATLRQIEAAAVRMVNLIKQGDR